MMRRCTARFVVVRDSEAIFVWIWLFVPIARSVVCECNLQCSNAARIELRIQSSRKLRRVLLGVSRVNEIYSSSWFVRHKSYDSALSESCTFLVLLVVVSVDLTGVEFLVTRIIAMFELFSHQQ